MFKAIPRFLDRGISGAGYWSTGVALFLFMYVGAQQIAIYCLHRYWTFAPGWTLLRLSVPTSPAPQWNLIPLGPHLHMSLGAVLLLIWFLPFWCVGFLLTVRRVRTLGWRDTLALVYFLPLVNLGFFILLSLSGAPWGEDFLPGKTLVGIANSDWLIMAMIIPFSLLMVFISIQMFETYGWMLFVVTPMATGYLATYFFNAGGRRGFGQSLRFSLSLVAFDAIFLALSHLDGLVCIAVGFIIVSPFITLGVILAFLLAPLPGAAAAYVTSPNGPRRAMFGLIAVLLPTMIPVEGRFHNRPEEFQVQSRIVIAAPPEVVWQHVVTFSEISEPPTGLLRTGVAYPTHAEIVGTGPGAIRYCVFSTGRFVEPIQTWEQPYRLAFAVSSQPPVMQETMLPGGPPTLHVSKEYLRSRHGEFLLKPLPGGYTELTGTTWYDLKFWPAAYWHLWTDAVVHRIHMRVLEHIKQEVEHR